MALTAEERISLFKAIYLLDSSPNILDLDQAFSSVLRHAALPHKEKDSFSVLKDGG